MSECLQHSGAMPIRQLWIDTTKCDDVKQSYRSRLVAREKLYKGENGRALLASLVFSAVHPLEEIKMLGSLMVTMLRSRRGKPLHMQAHFHETAQSEPFVDLQEKEQVGEHCGLLVKSMYGIQDASALCQDVHTRVLENAMYIKGRASPALFYGEFVDCRILVDGDDVCAVGDQDAMDGLDNVLRHRCELLSVLLLLLCFSTDIVQRCTCWHMTSQATSFESLCADSREVFITLWSSHVA